MQSGYWDSCQGSMRGAAPYCQIRERCDFLIQVVGRRRASACERGLRQTLPEALELPPALSGAARPAAKARGHIKVGEGMDFKAIRVEDPSDLGFAFDKDKCSWSPGRSRGGLWRIRPLDSL